MALQLIALDMDGTTLNSHHEISPAVKVAIKKAQQQGVHILIASGRPFKGIQRYLEQLELNVPGNYVVSNNGALVHHAHDGSLIHQQLLGYEDYRRCQQVAESVGLHFHVIDFDNVYTANRDISPYTVRHVYLSQMPLFYRPADEMPHDAKFSKFMFVDHPEVLTAAIPNIPKELYDDYTLMRSSDFFLELFRKGSDKGVGVRVAAEQLGINKDDIMCVGDHENDIPMLTEAGISVAMGNAIQSVKAVADFVTETNDNDGVAMAIEKHLANG